MEISTLPSAAFVTGGRARALETGRQWSASIKARCRGCPPAAANVRNTEFVTVADVAAFVVANMPPGQTDALSLDESLSILAFDLSANGIELEEKLTLELARTLEIPRN